MNASERATMSQDHPAHGGVRLASAPEVGAESVNRDVGVAKGGTKRKVAPGTTDDQDED